MRIVQQLTSKLHPKLIIATILSCVAVWSVMMYFEIDSKSAMFTHKDTVFINVPSPIASTPLTHSSAPRMASSSLLRHHAVTAISTPMPQATMSSTSMHIHQTSDARVQSIGSGGGGGGALAMTSHSHSSRSVSASSSYTGSFYIPMANKSITAVGAKSAEEVVDQKMGITSRRKTEDGDYPGGRPDPVPDEEDPVPVGDVAWGMMTLLAVAYAYIIYRKRTRA